LQGLKVVESGSCNFLVPGASKPTLKRLRTVGTDVFKTNVPIARGTRLAEAADLEMIEEDLVAFVQHAKQLIEKERIRSQAQSTTRSTS
jgi:hypothetical protein